MDEQQKDDRLWQIARRRAEFKKSFFSFLVVTGLLWVIWWFTAGQIKNVPGYPWPIWPTIGWGVGLAFQYFKAYNGDKDELTEKEYERLKREKEL
jgi:hypothetical protein